MPRSLDISPEIAAAIGPVRAAAMVTGPHPAEYGCTACHVRGLVNDGEDLVGGLDVHPNGDMRFWIAHRRCHPGVIRRVGHALEHPDLSEVVGVFGAHTTPLGVMAWLVIEHLVSAHSTLTRIPDDPREIDMVLAGHMRLGMEPYQGLHAPAAPHKPGWRIVLPGGGPRPGVYAPEGVAVMNTLPPIPDGWRELVRDLGGSCNLAVGTRIGLNELSRPGGHRLITGVKAVADAGRLLGITARVVA